MLSGDFDVKKSKYKKAIIKDNAMENDYLKPYVGDVVNVLGWVYVDNNENNRLYVLDIKSEINGDGYLAINEKFLELYENYDIPEYNPFLDTSKMNGFKEGEIYKPLIAYPYSNKKSFNTIIHEIYKMNLEDSNEDTEEENEESMFWVEEVDEVIGEECTCGANRGFQLHIGNAIDINICYNCLADLGKDIIDALR